jgi:hypothetical protein
MVLTETQSLPLQWGAVEALLDVGDEAAVAVNAHDSSRVEWTAVLPTSQVRQYRFVFELDVPANIFPSLVPWAQLQSFARFERPHDPCDHKDAVSRLREQALIATSRLAAAGEGFARHVRRLAAGGERVAETERRALLVWLQAGLEAIARARAPLAEETDPATERERGFVDEYLSTQLVATLTGMVRTLGDGDRVVAARIADALIAEADHRRARGYLSIESTSRAELEHFVERAGVLKKRFQGMLYLRRESTPIEERIRPWVTALSAATAGAVAFALQLVFGTGRSAVGQQLGWGFVVLLMLVAVTYGTKERLQIAGVHWLSRSLGRWYARRATRFYTASRTLVLSAQESFDERAFEPADADATTPPMVRLRFVHEGHLRAAAARGHLRLIFRFDLSPLLPRLRDPIKAIGVVDRNTHRVQLVDAPRTYRLPVRAALTAGDAERRTEASLVLDKFGLQRVEAVAAPHPTRADSGASSGAPPPLA